MDNTKRFETVLSAVVDIVKRNRAANGKGPMVDGDTEIAILHDAIVVFSMEQTGLDQFRLSVSVTDRLVSDCKHLAFGFGDN